MSFISKEVWARWSSSKKELKVKREDVTCKPFFQDGVINSRSFYRSIIKCMVVENTFHSKIKEESFDKAHSWNLPYFFSLILIYFSIYQIHSYQIQIIIWPALTSNTSHLFSPDSIFQVILCWLIVWPIKIDSYKS